MVSFGFLAWFVVVIVVLYTRVDNYLDEYNWIEMIFH